jgi:TolA-binding protein
MRVLRQSLLAVSLICGIDRAPAADPTLPTVQERYDAARRLMQRGNFDAAAEAYRSVAESGDAAPALRAQALFSAGLMWEHGRQYERALAIYGEVVTRFPATDWAKRAQGAADALAAGDAVRGLEFRRRQDAAWDELFPAQAIVARGDLDAARPGLERSVALLEAIVRDFPDHPQAKDMALALGNAYMTLVRFGDARAAYERAIALAQPHAAAAAPGGSVDSFVLDARERRAEAIRAARRRIATRAAIVLLVAIGATLLLLRPWRAVDGELLRLGAGMALMTLLLAAVGMAVSYYLLHFTDLQSPVATSWAGLLVVLPGLAGEIVTLAFLAVARRELRWTAPRAAGVGALLGALAALAVATCLVNAFQLFPFLDSDL